MTDNNSEAKKAVKNQLFTASVTGGTFEDFAQNAILFPVQDIPTTTVVNTPIACYELPSSWLSCLETLHHKYNKNYIK